MAIPPLNQQGWLPVGVHDCDVVEIEALFGKFTRTDRRIALTRKLREYVTLVREAAVGRYLYVDGSYVTDKDEPGDVDVLLVLQDTASLDRLVPPFEYNARSGKFVKRKFGFDFFFGFEGDDSSAAALRLFRRVKGHPDAEKGILRVSL